MKDVHVTLYDVAEKAGVSASTASRALAGLKVSQGNLEAVEKAAAELGYIPNEAARSLRVVRTMTVGMVFHQLTSQLGMELLGSLTSSLEKLGYSLFISTAQGDPERYDQLIYRFLERRVDALLCVHARGESKAIQRFKGAGVPALSLISRAGDYVSLPLVSSSIRDASRECVTRLRDLGHRHIVLLRSVAPVTLLSDFMSEAGDLATAIVPPRQPNAFLSADAALADLMQLSPRPTAVAALLGDAAALAKAAARAGLRVPEDLSIVAIRDRTPMSSSRRGLSIIHIDPTLLGPRVAEILQGWIESERPWIADLPVESGSWIERDSIGPVRQA